jgi:hypothetical protein
MRCAAAGARGQSSTISIASLDKLLVQFGIEGLSGPRSII